MPPQVTITAPSAGPVSGIVSITATASDAVGVVGVRFFVDGAQVGTEDGAAPYGATWLTGPVSDGPHTLTATARDAAGNVGTAAAVVVNVSHPDLTAPLVTIPAPAAGPVSGLVTVTASAFDGVGVVGVRIFVNGVQLGTEIGTPPYQAAWDTTLSGNGPHTLAALARDAAGNVGGSAGVAVTVSNPAGSTPPSVDTMVFSDGLNKRTTSVFTHDARRRCARHVHHVEPVQQL